MRRETEAWFCYCDLWVGYCAKLPFLSLLFGSPADLLRENQDSVSSRKLAEVAAGEPDPSLWLPCLFHALPVHVFVFFLKPCFTNSPGNPRSVGRVWTVCSVASVTCAALQWFPPHSPGDQTP